MFHLPRLCRVECHIEALMMNVDYVIILKGMAVVYFKCTIPTFPRRNWRKLRKFSVIIPGIRLVFEPS